TLHCSIFRSSYFFFFNLTPTTEIYTLSLHDALPISGFQSLGGLVRISGRKRFSDTCLRKLFYAPWSLSDTFAHELDTRRQIRVRSEEHTSELQSRSDLVCRLLLEKKKTKKKKIIHKT